MELFNKLGNEIENLWRNKNYNEELFPAIAADALKRADLPAKVSAWEVVEWALQQAELPKQKDVHARFADPPITLYSAPRFYIDVYFWLDATTAIHQHGFCGAFQVLLGSSIHSWYEFERREAVNSFTETGNMNLKLCELLEVGDVQEIWAGRQYIHSLFHLDQPSVTIVVRTEKSPLFLPQFSYHKPYFAVDPFFEDDTTIKKLQIITALLRSRHAEADTMISELLESSDFQTSFSILSRVHGNVQSNQLEKLFDLPAPEERFKKFLEIVRNRHGEKGEIFTKVFEHREMQNDIVRKRSYVTDAEHRFFFALLLNVESREQIFSLVKQRFPASDPLEKVLDWVFDLSRTRVVGANTPNALGVPDFDELEMFILENLLKDKTGEEIKKAYSEENPNSEPAAVTEAIAKVRNVVIFRPLLA